MDPNPIKQPAVLLAHVRNSLQPVLENAGFRFENRNDPRDNGPPSLWIDYSRGKDLVSLRWDARLANLTLVKVNENCDVHVIASVNFDAAQSGSEVLELADQFVQLALSSAF